MGASGASKLNPGASGVRRERPESRWRLPVRGSVANAPAVRPALRKARGSAPVPALTLRHPSPFGPGWCGRGDSNPHRSCDPTDFHTSYGFRRRRQDRRRLWSGLSLHHVPVRPGFRCCPSSLYTFRRLPGGLARDCHASGEVSPNLSSSTPRVSARALNG